MSHVTVVELEIKDLEAVHVMCRRLGWRFMEGQSAYRWSGRCVTDCTLPDDFTRVCLGKCDHVIRVPGAIYEVGLVKRGDKYVAMYDLSDPFLKEKLGGAHARVLKMYYGVEAAKLAAKRRGYKVSEEGGVVRRIKEQFGFVEKKGIRLCLTR